MLEKLIERVLFATRWLLAPLCIAMSLVLVVLGYVFMKELWHMKPPRHDQRNGFGFISLRISGFVVYGRACFNGVARQL